MITQKTMKNSCNYTLISFYTNDWKYKKYADAMIQDCILFNIPYVIQEQNSLGSYHKNCVLKPKYILEKLNQLKSPVLWTDIDNKINQKPILTNFKNVAVPKCPSSIWPGADRKRKVWFPIHILYFEYSEFSLQFLKNWIDICEENFEKIGNGKHEHGLLMDMISEKNLYSQINDLGKGYWHRSVKNPVIGWGFSKKLGRI